MHIVQGERHRLLRACSYWICLTFAIFMTVLYTQLKDWVGLTLIIYAILLADLISNGQPLSYWEKYEKHGTYSLQMFMCIFQWIMSGLMYFLFVLYQTNCIEYPSQASVVGHESLNWQLDWQFITWYVYTSRVSISRMYLYSVEHVLWFLMMQSPWSCQCYLQFLSC